MLSIVEAKQEEYANMHIYTYKDSKNRQETSNVVAAGRSKYPRKEGWGT